MDALLIDWVPDPVFWIDWNGRLARANQAACRKLGYSEEELLRLCFSEIAADLPQALRQAFCGAGEALGASSFTTEFHRKDGSSFLGGVTGRWIEIEGRIHCLCFVRDISDHDRFEKELADTRQRLRALIDNIPDIAWMKDTGSRFVEVNEALVRSWGLSSPDQLIGKTDYDFSQHDLAQAYMADDAEVVETNRRKCVEEEFVGHDGRQRWIETIKTPVRGKDGIVIGTVGIARDITERQLMRAREHELRESLERIVSERTQTLRQEVAVRRAAEASLAEKQVVLEAVLENTSAVIYVKDLGGKYLLANKYYLDLLGVTREAMLGTTDFDNFPSDIAASLRENDRAVLDGNCHTAFEETVATVLGVKTFISLKAPLKTADGVPFAICGISTDISERKQAEQFLNQAKIAAEQAGAAKMNFLATVSHELRTPLNAIIGFSEALQLECFGCLNVTQRDYCRTIAKSGHHLLSIINDILDYTKINAGKLALQEAEVDVGHLLRGCLELVELGRHELETDIAAALPAVFGDQLRLRQIVVNLLGNAVKFTPPPGRILLGAYCRDDGGVTIRVGDSGIGMAEEDIPLALEMFTQIDSSLARRHEGTGLGLALVKTLTERHGGAVAIESRVGQGTTVSIHLPSERSRPMASSPSVTP